jgi:hypothetical protein
MDMTRISGRLPFIALLATSLAVAACATGATPPTASAPTSPPSASASTAVQGAIVGEWVGFHECERIVPILRGAGLDEFLADAVVGNGLIPGATSEAAFDPEQPCAGAVRREHSHFFTADGKFGSKDFNGQQVDDGHYEIQGEDTIVINDLPFRFHIDGDQLTLEPELVDISSCTTKECRFGAAWVLMVALPGTTWTRGSIAG